MPTCIAVALLAPPAAADVLVVDANGSSAFGDIQPAVAAAQPGDSILVRPGQYSNFVVDKPISVLGAGPEEVIVGSFVSFCIGGFGKEVCPKSFGSTGVTVRDLPAGTTAFVSGMYVRGYDGLDGVSSKVLVDANAGFVQLHEIETGSDGFEEDYTLRVVDSDLLLLSSCKFQGSSGDLWGQPGITFGSSPGSDGANVIRSTVWVMGSELDGGNASPQDSFVGGSGHHGLQLESSVAYLARSQVTGGAGGPGLAPPFLKGADGTGVYSLDSVLKNVGGPDSTLSGGLSAFDLVLLGSSLAFHAPSVTLAHGANVLDNSELLELDVQSPTLATDKALVTPGDTVEVSILGATGQLTVLYVGNGLATPLTAPGVDGSFVLPLEGLLTLDFDVIGASGEATFNVQVPPSPAAVGFVGFLQAAVTDGNELGFTNATALPIY